MSYLHSHFKSDGSSKISLVHQDLTSANCLLYKENGQLRIKICDSAIRGTENILK